MIKIIKKKEEKIWMGDIYTLRSKWDQTAKKLTGNTKGRKWRPEIEKWQTKVKYKI